jgi:chorismate-pyruvate lyase
MLSPIGDRSTNPCAGRCVSASELISIYYPNQDRLGIFVQVDRLVVPGLYRSLLDHTNHMTVTVESHHRDRVNVEVLQSDIQGEHYRREILLRTLQSNRVVQYGIVRLNLKFLSEKPRDEILAQKKPLGRVLIEHNVLRQIELFDLLRVKCGPVLANHFDVPLGTETFGRTALLHCDDEPAIELLEVVAPEPNLVG